MPAFRRTLFWLFDVATLLVLYPIGLLFARTIYPRLVHLSEGRGFWWFFNEGYPTLHDTLLAHESLRAFSLVFPVVLIGVEIFGGHRPIRDQQPLKSLAFGFTVPITSVALLSLNGIAKTLEVNPTVVLTFMSFSCIAICFTRLLGRAWFYYSNRNGAYAEDIAFVAWPDAAVLTSERLSRTRSALEYRIAGYFSLLPNSGPVLVSNGVAIRALGAVQDIERVLINVAIQRIIIILPEIDNSWLPEVLRACDYFRVAVNIVPEAVLKASLIDLKSTKDAAYLGIPSLELASPDVSSNWLYVKRVLDVCVSSSMMVLLAPVFLLIATAIKVSTPHLPIFYPWRVVGSRGRRFTGYKFTTMAADAEVRREQLESRNEMIGPVFKIAKDPRVTPLGRFLRKYSLNEFPQLWSVLKGDMSLVGPRPAGPLELPRYELWQKRKLSAQPGITCFWQVRGRNRISSFDEWVQMDLEYIRDRSLWVDCQILVRTAWVVVRGSGC